MTALQATIILLWLDVVGQMLRAVLDMDLPPPEPGSWQKATQRLACFARAVAFTYAAILLQELIP